MNDGVGKDETTSRGDTAKAVLRGNNIGNVFVVDQSDAKVALLVADIPEEQACANCRCWRGTTDEVCLTTREHSPKHHELKQNPAQAATYIGALLLLRDLCSERRRWGPLALVALVTGFVGAFAPPLAEGKFWVVTVSGALFMYYLIRFHSVGGIIVSLQSELQLCRPQLTSGPNAVWDRLGESDSAGRRWIRSLW